jgi:hypothetical protein
MIEEDVSPEARGLEIIVDAEQSGDGACTLNYDEVGAGTHPISAISQGQQPATVRILEAGRAVVWHGTTVANAIGDVTGAESSDEGPPAAVPASEDRPVVLEAGEYRVECHSGGLLWSRPLHVTARSR